MQVLIKYKNMYSRNTLFKNIRDDKSIISLCKFKVHLKIKCIEEEAEFTIMGKICFSYFFRVQVSQLERFCTRILKLIETRHGVGSRHILVADTLFKNLIVAQFKNLESCFQRTHELSRLVNQETFIEFWPLYQM